MNRYLSVVLVVVIAASCVPLPYVKGTPQFLGAARTEDESAPAYCRRLAAYGDTASTGNLIMGVALTIIAGGLAVAGAAWGPDVTTGASEFAKNRATLVIAGGTLLAIPASLMLARVADQAKLAGEASRAMKGKGDLERCLEARAAFVESRSDAASLAQEKLSAVRQLLAQPLPSSPDAGAQDGGVAEPTPPNVLIEQLRGATM